MSLQNILALGQGGAGIPDTLRKAIAELQGIKFSVLAGTSANTTIALAAIRPEDTIALALQLADAGTATDQTSATTINTVKATGTATLNAVVAGNTLTWNGTVFTAVTSAAKAADPLVLTNFAVGANDTATALNLANAINAFEGQRAAGARVVASAAAAVVTITAAAEGTAANAYTLAGTATRFTVSGATLAGGTTTGGIKITNSTATSKVLLVWFDKNA